MVACLVVGCRGLVFALESLTKASCVTTLNKDYKAMLHFDSYISWYCKKTSKKTNTNTSCKDVK